MNPFNISIPPLNQNYFIPYDISLDVNESNDFLNSTYLLNKMQQTKTSPILFLSSDIMNMFPKTVEMVNDLLAPINIGIGGMSLLVSQPNIKPNRLHVDAHTYKGQIMRLESRLSFYNLSPGPGIISWWDTEYEDILLETTPVVKFVSKNYDRSLSWDQMSDPSYSIRTENNGFVRTNILHNVFQGNKSRITISCELVDRNTRLTMGVWDRIRLSFSY